MTERNAPSKTKRVRRLLTLDRRYPLPNSGAIFHSGLVLRCLDLDRRDHVLDAGCGTGHSTYVLAPKVTRSVGVDVSQPTIAFINSRAHARELTNRRLEYRCEDLCEPAFGERYGEAFTKAYSIHVLEHVSDPARFVRSLAQCIRPGGSVMVVFPNSRTHGRNFFPEATEIGDLFTRCGLFPVLYVMSRTFAGKVIAKVYYGLRNCYRMVRKESRFCSGNEFHETRYFATLDTTGFARLALSVVIEALLPLASRLSLYRLEPLGNNIEGKEICALAKKQEAI